MKSQFLLFFIILIISSQTVLVGCSDTGANTGSTEATTIDNVVQRIELNTSVAENVIEAIRVDPSSIADSFQLFKNEVNGNLVIPFSTLSEEELFVVYCSIIAYSLAPYGNSDARELADLLQEDSLDCDNYCYLTRYLFVEGINKNGMRDVSFAFVGWDCGAIGNHAEIFVSINNRNLLLDPTIGIVALADFNSVASGKNLPLTSILDLSTRSELSEYRTDITNALSEGLYKPSDLLYFFVDLETYKYPATGSAHWPTPGAALCGNRN
jgi:hypothetical protein